MSYICNITFVMAPSQEEEFLTWFRSEALKMLFDAGSEARTPVLTKVIEHGGEPLDPEHGLSIALKVEFPSLELLHSWSATLLSEAVGCFMSKFGPNVAIFSTTLETLVL